MSFADGFTKTLSDLLLPIDEMYSASADNKSADGPASAELGEVESGRRHLLRRGEFFRRFSSTGSIGCGLLRLHRGVSRRPGFHYGLIAPKITLYASVSSNSCGGNVTPTRSAATSGISGD